MLASLGLAYTSPPSLPRLPSANGGGLRRGLKQNNRLSTFQETVAFAYLSVLGYKRINA
jgi:hypothetical protein